METKDLIDYVKECPYCNDVCKEEIIQRLEEYERMRSIVVDRHLTQDQTMKDLFKLIDK